MTSKLVVNTIEADTGISSVSFASSISMSSTSKFHFGNAGIDIGADTNINRPEAGVLGFNINDDEKVRITNDGNLGIGYNSPTAKLHIIEATSTTAVKIKSGTNSNQNTHITLYNDNDVPLNLGVFGSAASTVGNIAANTAFMTSNSAGGLAINASNGSGVIKFGTGSSETERLRIDSNGLIIVGNGGTKFGNMKIQSFVAHGANASTSAFSAVDTTSVAAGVGGEIAFHGKYNTGAQDYAYYGHIRGIKENATNGNTACALTFHTRPNATAPLERLRILSDGKLLIGSTNPAYNSRLGNELCIVGTEAYTGMSITNYPGTNASHAPLIDFNRSRGSADQNMTTVAASDKLGELIFRGSNGSNFADAVTIRAYADTVSGSTVNGRFEIGTTNGAHSSKLIISKEGTVTKPNHPSFHARPPGGYSTPHNTDTIIGGTWSTSDSESFVRGTLTNGTSIWNNSTGIFTVPVTGIYYLHLSLFLMNNTTRRDALIFLNGTGSGNLIARTEVMGQSGTGNRQVQVSTVVSLSVNDQIRFGTRNTGSTNTLYTSSKPWSYACGYLIG